MQRLIIMQNLKRAYTAAIVMGIFSCVSGCQEANMAIDFIVGRQSPALEKSPEFNGASIILAARRSAGESSPPTPAATSSKPEPQSPTPISAAERGKRRGAGIFPPGVGAERPEEKRIREIFTIQRDPFRAPTEILPTECPPSMPLCRFDRSQLKLVGIIQVGDGQFKAMVEDPDGRGYFVTSGMQIGGATVTQVSYRGLTLHLHKNQQDVLIPLFRETKEASEM